MSKEYDKCGLPSAWADAILHRRNADGSEVGPELLEDACTLVEGGKRPADVIKEMAK
jgi:hypothetical protein